MIKIESYNKKKLLFILKKSKRMPNGCIEWTAGKDKGGYGHISYTSNKIRKTWKVHRLIYFLTKGEIPKGMYVCHFCDNPSCCNIQHLFLGTPKDNSQDRDKKGRDSGLTRNQNGSKNKQAKLTEDDVLLIRKLYSEGIMAKELAKIFKFTSSSICRIIEKRRWKHI